MKSDTEKKLVIVLQTKSRFYFANFDFLKFV